MAAMTLLLIGLALNRSLIVVGTRMMYKQLGFFVVMRQSTRKRERPTDKHINQRTRQLTT